MAAKRPLFTYGKQKKDYRLLVILALAVVAVFQSVLLLSPSPSAPLPQQDFPPTQTLQTAEAPIDLQGYEVVEVSVSPSVIYLSSGCRQISMVTTDSQTYSIKNGLDKKIDFRPTTHDIFQDLAESLGIEVRLVRIESMEDSTYYSKLFVQQGSRLLALDTKPSDAISIAVRFQSPIYIKSGILATEAVNTCA